MYTDGITEARNNHGEEFGEERLIEYLKTLSQKDSFFTNLNRLLNNFTGGTRSDDQTAFLIQKN
jgi:serine phosphatase RsbU (regulator of sigma subunit)